MLYKPPRSFTNKIHSIQRRAEGARWLTWETARSGWLSVDGGRWTANWRAEDLSMADDTWSSTAWPERRRLSVERREKQRDGECLACIAAWPERVSVERSKETVNAWPERVSVERSREPERRGAGKFGIWNFFWFVQLLNTSTPRALDN